MTTHPYVWGVEPRNGSGTGLDQGPTCFGPIESRDEFYSSPAGLQVQGPKFLQV